MGGFEFIQKCEAELKIGSKYIILTGFSDFEYARTAMKLSVVNYILKPVDEEELIESLNKVKKELDLNNKNLLTKFDYKVFVNSILKKFINGKIEQDKLTKIKQYTSDFENGEFTYVLVQPITWQYSLKHTNLDIYEIFTEVRKIIIKIVGEDMSIYILNENIGQGILFPQKMLYIHNNNLNSMLQKIIDDMLIKMSLHVIIYVGKKVNGITSIKESRDTCLNAVNTNFLLGRKGIIYYERIQAVNFNYNSESNEFFEELMESVEKNSLTKIDKNIDSIYKKLELECIAPGIIKANIANFELEVIKLIANMNGDVRELATSISTYQLNFMDIYDVKDVLHDFCVLASIHINNLKESRKSGVLYEVQEYINLNYNLEIRLKNISQHFYINPIYLGQIFKKKFNVSFNDYLNNYRIQKAKELLKNKKYKISEISAMVGYNDTNYFINKFEKITNTTLSEYRKNV